MKNRIAGAVVCTLTLVLSMSAAARGQEKAKAGNHKPDTYQYFHTDLIKPGMHQEYMKAARADAQAHWTAKVGDYYVGMESITGPDAVVYMEGFDSFADMVKTHEAYVGNKTLRAASEAQGAAEGGAEISEYDSLYHYRADLSLNPGVNFPKMRFMDITMFHVREGHEEDFERAVKLYIKAYQSIPDSHWAVFEKEYGENSGDTFILVTPLQSLAEEDGMAANGKKLASAVGDAQMETMMQLGASTIESSESDLFVLNPSISYVPAAWETDSPGFWNQ